MYDLFYSASNTGARVVLHLSHERLECTASLRSASMTRCSLFPDPHLHRGQCIRLGWLPSSKALIPGSAWLSGYLVDPSNPEHTSAQVEGEADVGRPHQQCPIRDHPLCCPRPRRPHCPQRRRPPLRCHTLVLHEALRSLLHPRYTIPTPYNPHERPISSGHASNSADACVYRRRDHSNEDGRGGLGFIQFWNWRVELS